MKNILLGTALMALVAIWLSPLGVGAFDVGCWILTNNQCTSIDWADPGRLVMVVLWTFVGGFVVVGIVGAVA